LITLIDRERERLHRFARQWGFHDVRTIRQSERLDKLINVFMRSAKKVKHN
jgi:hypothetical protein